MAGLLRESCLEIIDKTYEAINSSLDGKNVDSNIWLKDLSARMERINRLRKKKDYLETIKCLDRDGLQEYFNLVGRLARETTKMVNFVLDNWELLVKIYSGFCIVGLAVLASILTHRYFFPGILPPKRKSTLSSPCG